MYITLANQERSVVQSQSLFFNGKEFFLPYQSMHYFHTIPATASISHIKTVFSARFLWRIERCAEPISKVESHILAARPDSCASVHEKLSDIRLAPSRYLCVFRMSERIEVRVRRAGTHGKIFRAPLQPNPNLLSSKKHLISDCVRVWSGA